VPQLTQAEFKGIAPNRSAFRGQAALAENVDLSGGGLKPVKAPSFVEVGHSKDFIFHMGRWFSGDTNYLDTTIEGFPALICKSENNEWSIRVNGGPIRDLWIDKPTGFTVESSQILPPYTPKISIVSAGSVPAGTYEYFITFAQIENDVVVRESVACGAVELTVTGPSRVKVERPALRSAEIPDLVWRLYRRQKGGTYAALVTSAPALQAALYDEKADYDLGDVIYPEQRATEVVKYRYVIVWVRNISGWISESVPSDLLSADQVSEGVSIKVPEDVQFPDDVTHWRIYRISLGFDPTTTFQLVAELGRGTREYIDYKDNIELGVALQSSYRADNGALVSAGIPDAPFEGMAGPFNGFYAGWIGRYLYLSQPGNPSWWPGAFVVEANFPIVAVTQTGGNIAVLTTGGVQFGYGVSPTAFALSQAIFGQGGSNPKGASSNFYLGYDGIYTVTEGGAQLLSQGFNREYFDSINATTGTIIQEKEKLFLFHGAGALVLDFRTNEWTTLSEREHSFTSVTVIGGEIYGLKTNGAIVKLFDSDEYATMDYEGTTDFGESYIKKIESLRLYGSGDVRVELRAIEDEATILTDAEVDLSSTYELDRTVYAPAWLNTEALRYRITGKGQVRSIMFEVEKGSTER